MMTIFASVLRKNLSSSALDTVMMPAPYVDCAEEHFLTPREVRRYRQEAFPETVPERDAKAEDPSWFCWYSWLRPRDRRRAEGGDR